MRLKLDSTQVVVEVEVGVELGNTSQLHTGGFSWQKRETIK